MKVAKKYRYRLTPSGYLDKDVPPKLLRDSVVISEQIIDDTNARTEDRGNGVFYEVDDEATKQYLEYCKKSLKDNAEKAELKKLAAEAGLIEAVTVSKRGRKPKVE